jgi:hypothetical protein
MCADFCTDLALAVGGDRGAFAPATLWCVLRRVKKKQKREEKNR